MGRSTKQAHNSPDATFPGSPHLAAWSIRLASTAEYQAQIVGLEVPRWPPGNVCARVGGCPPRPGLIRHCDEFRPVCRGSFGRQFGGLIIRRSRTSTSPADSGRPVATPKGRHARQALGGVRRSLESVPGGVVPRASGCPSRVPFDG
jgi:hypothetical protein